MKRKESDLARAENFDMVRMPAVAGRFYPAAELELRNLIGSFIDKRAQSSDVISCVLPHAGYIYSGRVAAQTLSCVEIKDSCIIVGPNHTGLGKLFSIMPKGSWRLPFGEVEIDEEFSRQLIENCKFLEEDSDAHKREHSIEVQIPLLQYFKPNIKIIPIIAGTSDLNTYIKIGQDIANTVKKMHRLQDTLFIASSDMTHYEEEKIARSKDKLAIDAILELNEAKLLDVIDKHEISMCGYVPVAIMISYAKAQGAKKARLIKYQTSADASGDYSSVVGYAGIIMN